MKYLRKINESINLKSIFEEILDRYADNLDQDISYNIELSTNEEIHISIVFDSILPMDKLLTDICGFIDGSITFKDFYRNVLNSGLMERIYKLTNCKLYINTSFSYGGVSISSWENKRGIVFKFYLIT